MLVKQFVQKGNHIHSDFFYDTLTFLKKVKNHSVPELENALFFNLLLSGRGIYEKV